MRLDPECVTLTVMKDRKSCECWLPFLCKNYNSKSAKSWPFSGFSKCSKCALSKSTRGYGRPLQYEQTDAGNQMAASSWLLKGELSVFPLRISLVQICMGLAHGNFCCFASLRSAVKCKKLKALR